MIESQFWKTKSLCELTPQEWEMLCDGCGQCCLCKFEDRDTAEICYTHFACLMLDIATCRCQDYVHRHKRVDECVKLSVENVQAFKWLPDTCAYRLLLKGLDLPDWHPLVSKDSETVHQAGISIRHRAIPESAIEDYDLELIPIFTF